MEDSEETLVDGPRAAPPRRRDELSAPQEGLRLVPGALISGRYRIMAPLGRGGMGEVYRADDLKLGHAVALKFLPESLARRRDAVERFYGEVRLARQVAHPNVCRVFDIGEAEGRPFLSMEYIDGEDLKSLMRRIGRLSMDKALEVSQQLCAGLAAIHESGVLHRDLKPSNIMIDGKGRARITDFGISALAGSPEESFQAGTPAYMAPEQRTGGRATVQSDLFSLGLVLYEIFSGHSLSGGLSGGEPGRPPSWKRPAPPSAFVPEVDPRVDAAVLQCLGIDPSTRPPSALRLAAALPGLHPLAAALAAGETPSPEMVAAAPSVGVLQPGIALACLVGVFLACFGSIALSKRGLLVFRASMPYSADVLAERSRDMLRGFALTPEGQAAYGFENNPDCSRYLEDLYATGRAGEIDGRLAAGRPAPMRFWYRQSPGPLEPWKLHVSPSDPPLSVPGEVFLLLDTRGHLETLVAVPHAGLGPRTSGSPDWPRLFAAAQLDGKAFAPARPILLPPVYSDSRVAWTGVVRGPAGADTPVRIEAGAFQGRPVWFRIVEPWAQADSASEGRLHLAESLYRIFFFFVVLAALPLVLRNIRHGRADTRWAWRLSAFTFCSWLAISVLGAFPSLSGQGFWEAAIGLSLRKALMVALCYLSLEPFLRRRWPERIIGWRRLLAGSVRDPLVGRDVLVGCLLGSSMAFLLLLQRSLAGPLMGGVLPDVVRFRAGSVAVFVEGFLADLVSGLLITLSHLVFLLVMRIVLRRDAAALFVTWLYGVVLLTLIYGRPFAVTIPMAALVCLLAVVSWARFGLLAGIVHWLALVMTHDYLMTLDFSSWYAWSGLFALAAVLGLSVYGFLVSTAGRPWFSDSLLDD